MLPALLLVGVGRARRFWIPIPVILLWPLWLTGWLMWALLKLAGMPWEKPLRLALVAGLHLSGVNVDIDSADGDHIHLRMV